MGILEYNGGTIVGMTGKNCVAIASDRRYGVRQLMTVSCNSNKVFQMNDKTLMGLVGLATDISTFQELINFKMKLYELKEERQMKPKIVQNLVSTSLYEKRFGPYFVEPIVGGLDADNNPVLCSFDFIGAISSAPDFVVSGTGSDQLYGVCESFWKPDMEVEDLFETISQCLLAACDRDCLSGWGGIVHIITPDKVITRTLKGRMD